MSVGGGSGEIKETAAERAQAEVGWKYWQDYMTRGKEGEAAYRERLSNLGSDKAKLRMREAGLADFAQSAGFGIDPNNMHGQLVREQARVSGRSDIGVASEDYQRDMKDTGAQEIIKLGRGIRDIGDNSLMSEAANARTREVARAESDMMRSMAENKALGQAVGYGVYKWTDANGGLIENMNDMPDDDTLDQLAEDALTLGLPGGV